MLRSANLMWFLIDPIWCALQRRARLTRASVKKKRFGQSLEFIIREAATSTKCITSTRRSQRKSINTAWTRNWPTRTSLRSGKRMVTKNCAAWLVFKQRTLNSVEPASAECLYLKDQAQSPSSAPTVAAWDARALINNLGFSESSIRLSTL